MAGEHSFRGVDYPTREARNAGIVKQWIEGPPDDPQDPLVTYALALDAGDAPDEMHPYLEKIWGPGMSRAEYVEAVSEIARDGTLERWHADAQADPEYAQTFGAPSREDESMPAPTM